MHESSADERPAALVMEFDTWERDRASVALAAVGFRVVGVSNGASGLRALQYQPFDIILLDVLLPEVLGWHVLQVVKATQTTRCIPVVLIGASSTAVHELAEGLIRKPLEDSHVVEEVGRVLVRHAAPHEHPQYALRDVGWRRWQSARDGSPPLSRARELTHWPPFAAPGIVF
jgi:DNA-binding response OmpR family regulator